MAIYLDKIEADYLKELLEKHQNSWWFHQKLIDKVNVQLQEWEKFSKCNHEKAEYKGLKACCSKCGSFFEEGMGFIWEKKGIAD